MIASNDAINETLGIVQYQLIIATIIVLFLSIVLAWTIAAKLAEPIRKMTATAKNWANGDSEVVFSGGSYDELNELAENLNHAKDGVAKTGSLQRDLLANVSHDLKTPLTMIKAYAEMIRDLSGDNKVKRDQHTNVIIDEADRLAMLVNDILNLSKLQNSTEIMTLSQVNLTELNFLHLTIICEIWFFHQGLRLLGLKVSSAEQVVSNDSPVKMLKVNWVLSHDSLLQYNTD